MAPGAGDVLAELEKIGAELEKVGAGLEKVGSMLATFTRVGLLAPLRPDKYLRMVAAAAREGGTTTTGIGMAAQRCGSRAAVIDELGELSYTDLDRQAGAVAAGLQRLVGTGPAVIGLMCRNHREFIVALAAANRIGADVLLLNTSFAGPALAEVVAREGVDLMIYDEEFTAAVDLALAGRTDCVRVLGWTDTAPAGLTLDDLAHGYAGRSPARPGHAGRLVMLTSGTTGTPKGARRSGRGGGSVADLKAMFDRIPWHTEEPVVIAAPMFHAWGFSQLALALTMSCTIVTRRRFDPEATLAMVNDHAATGLCVVPVMFDRIMALPEQVLDRYPCAALRFATASGSRMHPQVVTAFMDRFGDVIYNNYNATEAGMIALATPADLRYAPDTAGTPAPGTQIRILDGDFAELPAGATGQIFVRNSSQFDGYTGGDSKAFHDGFMASGDLGCFDETGRLFVVGRDDEMIVSGGENIYPIEVEKVLVAHPGVAEAAVFGVDDEAYGQRLVAFVAPRPGAELTEETLKDHVRANLAGYKVPRSITLLTELPRNNTGKVARRELLESVAG